MKRNEYGNPVNYEDIYITQTGGYKKVYIEYGNPANVKATLSALFEKNILDKKAEIVLEIADVESCIIKELFSILERCPSGSDVTVRLFLRGFSDYSYEKLSLKNFRDSRRAIEEICRALSEIDGKYSVNNKRKIKTEIQYLLYQFNMMDVRKAAIFADELGASFCCVFACFLTDQKKRQYLALEMPVEEIIQDAESCFFTYLDDLENGECLYEKFRKPQTVRVNGAGLICLEWYAENEDREIDIERLKGAEDLDRVFRSNFRRASAVKYSGDIWLWNQMMRINRNSLFRIGVKE